MEGSRVPTSAEQIYRADHERLKRAIFGGDITVVTRVVEEGIEVIETKELVHWHSAFAVLGRTGSAGYRGCGIEWAGALV